MGAGDDLASSAFQGSLFSNAFVEGAITDLPDWSALGDTDLLKLRDDIAGIFARFPTGQTPNETHTEDDLIWRVLALLGWSDSLRQQNLTTKGLLLFRGYLEL